MARPSSRPSLPRRAASERGHRMLRNPARVESCSSTSSPEVAAASRTRTRLQSVGGGRRERVIELDDFVDDERVGFVLAGQEDEDRPPPGLGRTGDGEEPRGPRVGPQPRGPDRMEHRRRGRGPLPSTTAPTASSASTRPWRRSRQSAPGRTAAGADRDPRRHPACRCTEPKTITGSSLIAPIGASCEQRRDRVRRVRRGGRARRRPRRRGRRLACARPGAVARLPEETVQSDDRYDDARGNEADRQPRATTTGARPPCGVARRASDEARPEPPAVSAASNLRRMTSSNQDPTRRS